MRDILKTFYEVYVMKSHDEGFSFIHKFDTKEDAVVFLLNYSTVQNMRNIYWQCADERLYLFDEDLKDKKAYIEICYESISNNLVDKDLIPSYKSMIDLLNTYEESNR